tara:strand:- start:469 stop:1257 length:789 start_codon:yes stop_codon:yes gene_type:complete
VRILISTGYWQHKTNHYFSKRIQELCSEVKVGVIGSTESLKYLKKVIKNDHVVDYKIYNTDKIQVVTSELDYDELIEFEQGLSGVSLFQVISSSRGVRAYQHGSSYTYTSPKNFKDRDELLFNFAERLFKMRTIFNDFKPDMYYESPGMDGWGAYINQQLCMERNIPYLLLQLTCVKNYFAISDNPLCLFPQIDKTYLSLINKYKEDEENFIKAESLYDLIMEELESPVYFDRNNSRFNFLIDSFHAPENNMINDLLDYAIF